MDAYQISHTMLWCDRKAHDELTLWIIVGEHKG
jgi:hypothetical protein